MRATKKELEEFGDGIMKMHGNDYNKARDFLYTIGITDVFRAEGKWFITVRRPGILIGRKGTTIERVKEALGCPICILEEVSVDLIDQILPMWFGDSLDDL